MWKHAICTWKLGLKSRQILVLQKANNHTQDFKSPFIKGLGSDVKARGSHLWREPNLSYTHWSTSANVTSTLPQGSKVPQVLFWELRNKLNIAAQMLLHVPVIKEILPSVKISRAWNKTIRSSGDGLQQCDVIQINSFHTSYAAFLSMLFYYLQIVAEEHHGLSRITRAKGGEK